MSWSLLFSEPIVLPDGTELLTLRDAHDHLNKLPKSKQDTEAWIAAAYCLTEAAENGGAIAFARIGTVRVIKQQEDPTLASQLVDFTMRQVEDLKADLVEPISSDQKASPVLPGVVQVIAGIISSPAVPIAGGSPSIRREPKVIASITPTEDKNPIGSQTLQSAITKAVQKTEPAFVSVIVRRVTPKSRFDADWALRGVRFGRADREKARKVVTGVVERMQGEFRLDDD